MNAHRVLSIACVLIVALMPWSDAAADPTVLNEEARAPGVFAESSRVYGAPDSKTGAMQYTYAFELPTPRGHVSSSLSLSYSSSSRDREAGYGWGLDLPVIERRPLSGRPRFPVAQFDSKNTRVSQERYFFDGQPLVECTAAACSGGAPPPSWGSGWRLYRLQVETLFARFYLSPNGSQWRVQLKGGELLEFGTGGSEATEYVDGDTARIVRWRLARRVDTVHAAGGDPASAVNVVVYRWQRLGARPLTYLTDIWDTPPSVGAGLADHAHHVQLTWEEPPFLQTTYADAHLATPDRRLARVAIASKTWSGSGQREIVRSYELRYLTPRGSTSYTPGATAPLWNHSFLKEIQQFGNCRLREESGQVPASIPCPSATLPPVKFQYQGDLLGFGTATPPTIQGGPPNVVAENRAFADAESATIIDVNRDGLPDLVQGWETGDCFNIVEGGGTNDKAYTQLECTHGTPQGGTTVCTGYSLRCRRKHWDYDPPGCAPPSYHGEEDYPIIRNARPMTLYANRAVNSSTSYTLNHGCIDAGLPPNGAGEPPVDLSRTPIGVNGNGYFERALAKFFTSQGAVTLLGPWGFGNVLWEPSSPTSEAFASWYAKPILGGSLGANCDLQNFNEAAFTPGWRWTRTSTLDWALPAGPPNTPPPDVSSRTWYVDLDGDGLTDALSGSGHAPGGAGLGVYDEYESAWVSYTRRYAPGESIDPTLQTAPTPKQKPFVFRAEEEPPIASDVSLVPANCRFHSYFFYTDINGDGLVDAVVTNSDVDGGVPRVRPGHGDGLFMCSNGAQPWSCIDTSTARPSYAIDVPGPTKPWPFTPDTYFHDLTGDGLADIVQYNAVTGRVRLWVNQDGRTFACSAHQMPDPCDIGLIWDSTHGTAQLANHRISFADMNADGVDDLVVLARTGAYVASVYPEHSPYDDARARRPGLLIKIDNGVGATTKIRYSTIQELDVQAEAGNQPWLHHAPAVEHVVTQIMTQDTATAQGGSLPPLYSIYRVINYSYRDPAYDRWTRAFAGFRKVREHDGTGAVTETTYWFGPCQNYRFFADPNANPADDPELRCSGTSDDELDKARTGQAVRVDRYVPGNVGQGVPERRLWSRIVRSFDAGSIPGVGRHIRWALPALVETYLYDTELPATTAPNPPPEGGADVVESQVAYQDVRKTLRQAYDYDANGTIVAVWDDGVTATGSSSAVDTRTLTRFTDGDLPPAFDFPTPPNEPSSIALPCNANWECNPRHVTVYGKWTGSPSTYQALRRTRLTYSDSSSNGGDVVIVEGFLEGAFPLQRSNNGQDVAPSPPDALYGWRPLASFEYDTLGNVRVAQTAPESRNPPCTTFEYDVAYRQFPHVIRSHKNGCGSPALVSTMIFDRGFEQPVITIAPSGAMSEQALDGLGRVKEVFAPEPDMAVSETMSMGTINYVDAAPLSTVEVVPTYGLGPRRVGILNGIGESVLSFVESESGGWIADTWTERNQQGQVARAHKPFAFSGNPVTVAQNATPITPPSHGWINRVYEPWFGRYQATQEVFGTGFNDLVVHESVRYRPLEVETRDAEQIKTAGPHTGAFTLTKFDGHGRAWFQETHVNAGASPSTETEYTPTGEPMIVRRRAGSAPVYERRLHFDSFGRLQRNEEPNTSSATADWRYTWDDAGRLVGTSDARGCGKNIFYDGLGRVQGEDYSPCTADHAGWTSPNLTTGERLEVWNVYDAYESGQMQSDATFIEASSLAEGQLVASRDRGSYTRFNYDNRGRVRRISRRPTKPLDEVDTGSSPYVATWFKSRVDYDAADRLASETTGVPSPAFLIYGGNESNYKTHFFYNKRGLLQYALNPYGSYVLRDIVYEPDGAVRYVEYGDSALTRANFYYDLRGRLTRHYVTRAAPAIWSYPPPGYTPPTPGTLPGNLTPFDYQITAYDDVGNPTAAANFAGYSVTSSYAPLKTRTMVFDDLYRMVSRQQDYHVYSGLNGNGGWFSPFDRERATGDRHPIPLQAASAVKRVRQQTFAYDATGNITSTSDNGNLFYDRSLGPVTYGVANQMDAATTIDLGHDVSGNMTEMKLARNGTCSDGLASRCAQWLKYDWDEVGQLVRARRWDFIGNALPAEPPTTTGTVPAWDLRFAYSGGARILKTATPDTGPVENTVDILKTLRYTRAAYVPAAEDYEVNPDKIDLYLGDGTHLVHDGPRLMVQANASMGPIHVFIPVPDHLGSTAVVLDQASSEVVQWATYYPHGAIEQTWRSPRFDYFREDYGFTGKEEDIEIGLMNFGARYYAPYLGRWASADPLTVHGLGSDLNPYAYVRGRVATHVDPIGLDTRTFTSWCAPGYCDGDKEPLDSDVTAGRAEAAAMLYTSQQSATSNGNVSGPTLGGTLTAPRPSPGRPFANPGLAGWAALAEYNGYSIRTERELGGLIYLLNGKYYHTPAVDTYANSNHKSFPFAALALVDPDAFIVGMWHTHGTYFGPGENEDELNEELESPLKGGLRILSPVSQHDRTALKDAVGRRLLSPDGIGMVATSSGHISLYTNMTPVGRELYLHNDSLRVDRSKQPGWSAPWYRDNAGRVLPPR